MEPVHYVRALRRRWWVIAASVVVASAAAWLTTAAVPSAQATAAPPTAYTATTVLWNTGAPTLGQGSPITSTEALAQVVTLPGPTSIAARSLVIKAPRLSSPHGGGVSGRGQRFPEHHGHRSDPRASGRRVLGVLRRAPPTYLKRLNVRRIDESQRLLLEQINTLQQQGVDPTVIASLRTGLSQLALDRTAPVPITTIQQATAVPVVADVHTAPRGSLTAPKSRAVRTLLGALIGLLAGIVLALVLERFDTRIRSARAAEEAFGLPVLAEVPSISRRRRKKVVTVSYPYSTAADAFRLVGVGASRWWSTNGNERDHRQGAETILVTSPEARDGKTTVAANLAAALAQSGKRVVVVSCDLRRPTIHEMLGVSIQPGLSDALYATNGHQDAKGPDLAQYLEPGPHREGRRPPQWRHARTPG